MENEVAPIEYDEFVKRSHELAGKIIQFVHAEEDNQQVRLAATGRAIAAGISYISGGDHNAQSAMLGATIFDVTKMVREFGEAQELARQKLQEMLAQAQPVNEGEFAEDEAPDATV